MRFVHQRHPSRQLAVELTPMIDVVFLLIIFFLTTAQFARLTRAEVDLPLERGEQEKSSEEAGIVVNIDRAGQIIVSGDVVTLEDLELIVQHEIRRLETPDPRAVKLMIRADRGGSTDRLNQIVSRLQGIGVGAARLATEVPR